MRIRFAVIVIATVMAVGAAGCLVVGPRPVAVVSVGPPVEYGYQPLLYDGYVVYYTNEGVPFYWRGNTRVWVPVPARPRYVTHWRTHRHGYERWHRERGTYYRSRHYQPKHRPAHEPKRKHREKREKKEKREHEERRR